MSKPRIAIISTHPVQYNAPVFQMLHQRGVIDFKVFYTWSQLEKGPAYDPGFQKTIAWDIPLLEGYSYQFVENIASEPGSHHYKGIDNPTLIREIENYRPDAIMTFSWKYKSHFKLLRHFHGKVPIFFRGDSTLLDEKKNIKSFVRWLVLSYVYRHIDTALYVGKNNKDYFMKHGVGKERLFFIPHAIDNSRFSSNSDVQEEEARIWRRDLGIPGEALVFLFAGKLEGKKNPQLLLRCFCKAKIENSHLVIVGNGELESELKKEYGDKPGVHFVGFQNQTRMPVVYRLGDVFVLPSKGPEETWGLAINEAMACKRAVLVSDKCGGAIDLVRDGVNGYIFKSNDEQDLVSKLSHLAAGRDKLKQMGEESYTLIQNFSFKSVCEQLEAAVHSKI